jgi:hypothetical protein
VATTINFQISVLKKNVYTRLVLLASCPHIVSFILQANNMVALHDLAEMTQRHSLLVLLVLAATGSSSSSSAQSTSTAVDSRETKTSAWWPIVECVFLDDDVNKCLQDRTVRTFVGLGTAS